jgi:hypothetical protein
LAVPPLNALYARQCRCGRAFFCMSQYEARSFA